MQKHRRRTLVAAVSAVAVPLLAAACVDGDNDRRSGGIFDQRGGVFGGGDRGRGVFGGGPTVAFRCDDDRSFEATFRDRGDEVVVRTRSGSYRLELENRGGRELQYGDDDVVLYVEDDGDDARLRIKDEPDYKDCRGRRSGFF